MLYRTQGVCSRAVDVEIENGKVKYVKFIGGCPGNTKGVERLTEGMDAQEACDRLKGIDCCGRGTSCPDQLSRAIGECLNEV